MKKNQDNISVEHYTVGKKCDDMILHHFRVVSGVFLAVIAADGIAGTDSKLS